MTEKTKPGKTASPKRGARGHFLPGALNPKNLKPHESGIQRGTKHTSTMLKEAVLSVFFDDLKGTAFLRSMARSKKMKHHFIELLKKAMPQSTELTGKDGGGIDLNVLMLAKVGVANMTDEQLAQFRGLLDVMGVGKLLAGDSANDGAPAEKVVEEAAG